ncbi:MAG: CAP domain-containing protein [Microthrixaceae bacterium]|nr:CAP domain-containing protein [Microthrixaceae bacterium]
MTRSSTSHSSCRRQAIRLVAAVVALFALVSSTSACESIDAERNEVFNLVNRTRAENGLPQLKHDVILDIKADNWAQKLRNVCSLSHSKLSDGAPKQWLKLGENVGYGGTIAQIHGAYLDSPGHRANILDPAYNSMGTAAVWGDCDGQHRVFTVQVFMKS